MTSSRASLALSVAALLLAGYHQASAQKIAPTRDYSSYSDTPRERPDRQFGMPAFGRPALPEQKPLSPKADGPTTGSTSQEPAFPGGQGAGPGATANLATPRDPFEDAPGSTNDFFTAPTDFGLKPRKPADAAQTTTDTPLFTTQDSTTTRPVAPTEGSQATDGAAATDNQNDGN